jgi:hypothetical protein
MKKGLARCKALFAPIRTGSHPPPLFYGRVRTAGSSVNRRRSRHSADNRRTLVNPSVAFRQLGGAPSGTTRSHPRGHVWTDG